MSVFLLKYGVRLTHGVGHTLDAKLFISLWNILC